MVALLTPDASSMASILVASMPRSQNNSTAASKTFLSACALLGLAISADFNSCEQVGARAEEDCSDAREQRDVERHAEVPGVNQCAAQAVYPVCQRIKFGNDAHHQGQ